MPWCVGQNCCLFSLQIGFPPSLLNQTLSLLLIGFFFSKQKTFLLTLALKSVCRLHQNSSISCILCCAKGRGRSWCAGSGHCQPTVELQLLVSFQLGTCEMFHRCHCCSISGTTGTLWSPTLWHWAICWHGGLGAPELWYIWVCAEHKLDQHETKYHHELIFSDGMWCFASYSSDDLQWPRLGFFPSSFVKKPESICKVNSDISATD